MCVCVCVVFVILGVVVAQFVVAVHIPCCETKVRESRFLSLFCWKSRIVDCAFSCAFIFDCAPVARYVRGNVFHNLLLFGWCA